MSNINRILELEQEAQKLEQDLSSQVQYTRKRLKEILYEIELESGFIARGFELIKDYYQAAFTDYAEKYIASENAMKDYELLLNIPIGTYRHSDFVGLKIRKFISRSQAQDLEKATQIRQTWSKILAQYGSQPTGGEIRKYLVNKTKLTNTDKRTSGSSRIQELEEEVKALKTKLQLIETRSIHPITQNHIQRLTQEKQKLQEEKQKLQDKVARLENLLKQTQRVG